MRCEDVDWIDVAYDKTRLWAVMMNVQIAQRNIWLKWESKIYFSQSLSGWVREICDFVLAVKAESNTVIRLIISSD
jgi:hypothetical protein